MTAENTSPYRDDDLYPGQGTQENHTGTSLPHALTRIISFRSREENKIKDLSYSIARSLDAGLERAVSPLSNMLAAAEEREAMKNPRYVELRQKAEQAKKEGSLTRSADDLFEEIDILRNGREDTFLYKTVYLAHSSPTLRFTRTIISSVQRVRRGWADSDTWSLDHHIANTLSQQLFYLAENTHGWPQSDTYPEFEDWQNALRVNAMKLRNYAQRDNSILTDNENWMQREEEAIQEGKEAMRWIAENFEALWD